METREYYVYQQIYSSGISYDTTEEFKKDLSILPCNTVFFYDKCKGKYHNLAVIDKFIIPSMVYFDGVEKGIDCECYGDRWNKLDDFDKRKVFIFENKKEFEEALKNNQLERYNHYTILEDFRVVK